MAVIRVAKRPFSVDTYEAIVASMKLHTEHPLGLILHGANVAEGHVHVTQVWDSEEYARRYEEEILARALEAHGVEDTGEVRMIPLCDLVTP